MQTNQYRYIAMKYHRNVAELSVLRGSAYHQDENLPPSLGILCGNSKHAREAIIEMY